MDDFDPADLDGDGEFDAIDMEILENGEQEKQGPGKGETGCSVVLLAIGSSVGVGWWLVGNYLI